MEELAQLYRKIADMQSELADTEVRLENALGESAHADEMMGQMLARVGEVEARLRAAQKQASEAEARAGELTSQLGRARGAQAETTERMHAAETRLLGDKQEMDRLRSELEAARTEATVSIAAAEEAQDALAKEREQASSLRAEHAREHTMLLREREERESLRARVVEFAQVCEERDKALTREELLEADLEAVRKALLEAQRHAMSGEHRLGDQIVAKEDHIEHVEGELAQAKSRTASVEKELTALRRELESQRSGCEQLRGALAESESRSESRVAELMAEAALGRQSTEDAKRARNLADQQLGEAVIELADIAKAKADAERRAEEAEKASAAAREEADKANALARSLAESAADAAKEAAEQATLAAKGEGDAAIGAARAELAAAKARLGELEIEREMNDGIHAQTASTHEKALAALRESHAVELEKIRARVAEAGADATQDHDHRAAREQQLTTAREERDAALARSTAQAMEAHALRQELSTTQVRAEEAHGKLRGAIEDVTRTLADLDKREAEAARLRAGSLVTARNLLDQAVGVEHLLASVVRGFQRTSQSVRPLPPSDDEDEGPGEVTPRAPLTRREPSNPPALAVDPEPATTPAEADSAARVAKEIDEETEMFLGAISRLR